MPFNDKLKLASQKNNSLLCVGLDPNLKMMPIGDVVSFNNQIIEATSDLVCAYKPNFAFYEALGSNGLRILEKTRKQIPDWIPVIADAKRGDIGSTSEAYAKALFDTFAFDAATVNPYMGYDSLVPFIQYSERGVFILCKTSNTGSADFQNLLVSEGPGEQNTIPLFEAVAIKAMSWNKHGNIGLVVGANCPAELRRIRQLCPELPLLIPGIGVQGGEISDAVTNGRGPQKASIIINCARTIIYASGGNDFASAARTKAQMIRDEINKHIL